MRRFLYALLMFSCVAFAQESSQPPSPTPSKGGGQPQEAGAQPKEGTAKKDRGSDESPLSVKLLNTGKSPYERADEAKSEEERATRERWLIGGTVAAAFATVILAAITGFLATYTYKLWDATVELGRDAKATSTRQAEEVQRSLAAADKSAWAAEKTVKEMRRNATYQLRAYVALEGIHYDNMAQNHLVIKAKNYGQTPAHDLAIRITSDGGPSGSLTAPQMLHPGQVVVQRATLLPDNIVPHQVVNGRMIYRDAFDDWWITGFSYQHRGNNEFIATGESNAESGPYEERPS